MRIQCEEVEGGRIGHNDRATDVCEIARVLLLEEGRDGIHIGRSRRDNPKAFIVAKEEGLVSADRTTEAGAKLVLPEFRSPAGPREEVPSIEDIVPNEFVRRTMQCVASSLGNDVDDGSPGLSNLSRIVAGVHAELR